MPPSDSDATAARLERAAERYVPGSGPVEIDRLGSGLVNESYRVSRDGRRFSLRLAASRSGDLGLDRGWECRVLRCAALAGLAPAVACCEPRAGILVAEWVEGVSWTWEQAASPENLGKIAKLARRVHALPPLERPRVVSPAQWIAFYRHALDRPGGAEIARGRDRPGTTLDERAQSLLDVLRAEPLAESALCHGDLHAQNLLIACGGEPVILDWEYAHVSHPWWDLAGWACNADLTAERRLMLLRHYLDRGPAEEEAARLGRLAWLYDYVCLLWSELYSTTRSGSEAAKDAVSARARRLERRLLTTGSGCDGRVPAH